MAFYFSRRKIKVKDEEGSGELNIVPYLDILMNLIIFMLLSMTGLATFGILNVSAPIYGGAGGANSDEKPPLLLTVGVTKSGFIVAATGGVLPGAEGATQVEQGQNAAPTIPLKADGTFDYDALNAKLKEVKSAFPAESKIILAADAAIQYEVLVATMDATRETKDRKLLFPDVTLASF